MCVEGLARQRLSQKFHYTVHKGDHICELIIFYIFNFHIYRKFFFYIKVEFFFSFVGATFLTGPSLTPSLI